ICAAEMASLADSSGTLSEEERRSNLASRYWVLATLREAAVGLGDEAAAERWRLEAAKTEPADWMVKSTDEQVARLEMLLGNSPLTQLQPLSP
ncbi:MAG: hypothetical protein ACREF4_19750, partial [Gammaproteobacteria bacterium]